MKCVFLLLMFSICIPQNTKEYILATNDGEFIQITSFSKEEDGMLVWEKTSSIVSAKHKIIPYSQIKNIKDRNGNIIATNKKVYDLYVIPEQTENLNETLNNLNNFIHLSSQRIYLLILIIQLFILLLEMLLTSFFFDYDFNLDKYLKFIFISIISSYPIFFIFSKIDNLQ